MRERLEDMAELAEHFIEQSARRLGVPRPRLTKLHVQELQRLRLAWQRARIAKRHRARGHPVAGWSLQFDLPTRTDRSSPSAGRSPPPEIDEDEDLSLDELVLRERAIVTKALERSRWKIYGTDGAAAVLKIKPTTLVSKMKRLGVRKEATEIGVTLGELRVQVCEKESARCHSVTG